MMEMEMVQRWRRYPRHRRLHLSSIMMNEAVMHELNWLLLCKFSWPASSATPARCFQLSQLLNLFLLKKRMVNINNAAIGIIDSGRRRRESKFSEEIMHLNEWRALSHSETIAKPLAIAQGLMSVPSEK
jgi:hypothetical protein